MSRLLGERPQVGLRNWTGFRALIHSVVWMWFLSSSAHAQSLSYRLFTEVGQLVDDHLGWAMSGVGDLDGDGHDEFIAGSNPVIFQLAPIRPGSVRVYSGHTGLVSEEHMGDAIGDEFGISVDGTGDVDGDGAPDFVVGAPQRYVANLPGYVRVFSGLTGEKVATLSGSPVGEWFGCGVAGPGDLNGDGVVDLLVGIPGSDLGGGNAGTIRAYSGEWIRSTSTGQQPASLPVLYEVYGVAGTALGCIIEDVGYLDADGVRDFVASAPNTVPGYVQAHSGADGSLLWSVSSSTGVNDAFGEAVAGVGDIDGDGRDDVVVGAFLDPTEGQYGAAWVYSGADGAVLASLHGNDAGFPSPVLGLGTSAMGVGDVNGDRFPDFGLGARVAGDSVQGTLDVLSGEWIASTARGQAPVTPMVLIHFEGENASDWFGFSAAGLGDVNADGVTDFGISAPLYNGPGVSNSGAMYVFSGAALSLASSTHAVSLAAGGTQTLTLDAPAGQAGDLYLILGSASGTKPGVTLDGLALPLNLDAYTTAVAQLANQPPFVGFADFLDGSGDGMASFTIPPGLDPSLAGVTLDHAFVAIDLSPAPVVKFISNPVPVSFVP